VAANGELRRETCCLFEVLTVCRDLYIQAMKEMEEMDPIDRLSWFQIAGKRLDGGSNILR